MNVGDEIVFNDDGVHRPGHIQGIDGEDVLVVLASRKGARRVWREQVTVVATARRDALAREQLALAEQALAQVEGAQ